MQLFPSGNLESADPVLAVRWCLERSEAEQLRERAAANIHILLVIAYEGTDLEDRQIVPLDQMMTFLNFRRPGNHTVFAKVVWCDGDKPTATKLMKNGLLDKIDARSYSQKVLNSSRTGFRNEEYIVSSAGTVHCLLSETDIDVMVSREHFPKEPPAWLSKFVNVGYDYPPIDQCSFRRRGLALLPRLLGFGLWAVITTLLRVIAVAFLLFRGMRNINFGAVIHPWREDVDDVWRRLNRYSSWFRYTKQERRRQSGWIYLCYPPIYLFLFAWLTVEKIYYHVSYLTMLMSIGAALLAVGAVILRFLVHLFSRVWVGVLVFTCGFFLGRLLVKVYKIAAAKKRKRESAWEFQETQRRARERKEEASYIGLYKLLACRPGLIPSVSNLPVEHRTLRLKFLDLKSKLCRPYSAR
jgi:hypothetical protein